MFEPPSNLDHQVLILLNLLPLSPEKLNFSEFLDDLALRDLI